MSEATEINDYEHIYKLREHIISELDDCLPDRQKINKMFKENKPFDKIKKYAVIYGSQYPEDCSTDEDIGIIVETSIVSSVALRRRNYRNYGELESVGDRYYMGYFLVLRNNGSLRNVTIKLDEENFELLRENRYFIKCQGNLVQTP